MKDEAANRALCIHPEYEMRDEPTAFDDRGMADLWQDGVYRYARMYADRQGFRSVVDYGCGSGFKLMKYFSGFETTGYEFEPCLSYLKMSYPEARWVEASEGVIPFGDLLICSDVIEHMRHPTAFLERLKISPLQGIVLSTPSLEILAERGESPRLGPPDNTSHIREWTTREFYDYVSMHLTVIDHVVITPRQGTQLILAVPK